MIDQIGPRNRVIDHYSRLILAGDLSFHEAFRQYAEYEIQVADAYQKLAEDAINCRPATSFFLCAKCAKELS